MTIHTETDTGATAAPPGLGAPAAGEAAQTNGAGAGTDTLVVRANKLELLERLADDLAHEIKNPLHSMVINLEVLKRRVAKVGGDQDELQRYFGVLAGELERVNRRIELLLRLSRPGRGPETTTMSELAEELMELIQLEARHHEASVDYQAAPSAVRVRVSREPARQVILNLVMEALDGLPAGATLTIRVHRGDGAAHLVVGGDALSLPELSGVEPSEGRLGVACALAESAGGRVSAAPAAEGARGFVFTLPTAGG